MGHINHSVAVEGFEDYFVCPCGVVTSLKHVNKRILKSFPRSKYGHYAVNLCCGGRMITKSLHILACSVPQNLLARKFGVSPSTLNSIVLGRTWKHVAD